MKNVKIDKVNLLDIVRSNKQTHVSAYNESVNDYIAAALKIAEANLELAKSGDLDQIQKIRSLPPKPVSYEDAYTRAIRMLELSVDAIIELDDHNFSQLVLDEWQWKQNFTATSSLYKTI